MKVNGIKIYEDHWIFKLPFMGRFTGMTIGKKKVAFPGKFNLHTFAHETIHIDQIKRFFLYIIWLVVYFIQWVCVGFRYSKIPFEVEAYKGARERYESLVGKIIIEV